MRSLFSLFLFLSFSAAAQEGWQIKTERAEYVHRSLKLLTDVMVHDIYSPPVCSRTYAYVSIAGYEAAVPAHALYRSLAGQIKSLKPLPTPPGKNYSPTTAAVQAMLSVGKALTVSEGRVEAFQTGILKELKASGIPDAVFAASIAYGNAVAAHIMAWAAKDNYSQTRTFAKYAVNSRAATWKPTPPAYIKAVEPHWNKMRPFLMDSATQFRPAPSTPFSTDTGSVFFKEALAVKEIGSRLTPEQKEIANFWDCNPYKVNLNGHVMYATKKISPGGHWMNITGAVCRQSSATTVQSLEAYASVALALADAFISCWDEKYRSLVIRPETYINQYIDGGWMPLLQTPPFPEYPSGHSVVSTASAVVLTKLFGDGFAFSDSTEMEFGLPPRRFASFTKAAEEAAISRLYGGIHYRPSIANGAEEGRRIGAFVAGRLLTRSEKGVAYKESKQHR